MQTRAKELGALQISTRGLHLAENGPQIHPIDPTDQVFVNKVLRRSQMVVFFEKPPLCCIGAEFVERLIFGVELIKQGTRWG